MGEVCNFVLTSPSNFLILLETTVTSTLPLLAVPVEIISSNWHSVHTGVPVPLEQLLSTSYWVNPTFFKK